MFCSAHFTGGPSWSCKFHDEIEKSATNVGIRNNTIHVKVFKKFQGKDWPNLQVWLHGFTVCLNVILIGLTFLAAVFRASLFVILCWDSEKRNHFNFCYIMNLNRLL